MERSKYFYNRADMYMGEIVLNDKSFCTVLFLY